MRTGLHAAAALLVGGLLPAVTGCGGAKTETRSPVGGPAAVLAPLKALDTPYQIIYHPAVDLAKRPDTTKAAPAPRQKARS